MIRHFSCYAVTAELSSPHYPAVKYIVLCLRLICEMQKFVEFYFDFLKLIACDGFIATKQLLLLQLSAAVS